MNKVALLAPLPPPAGGIGVWALRVREDAPFQVELVDEALIGGRQVFGKKSRKNLAVEARRSIRIWKRLWTALNDRSIKVIHSNIPASTGGMARETVCALIAKLRRRRFVVHFHCTLDDDLTTGVRVPLFRLLCSLSDGVIVLNARSVRFARRHTRRRVWELPNFVHESEISTPRVASGPVRKAVFVGGVCEDKGIFEFFDVAREFPDIEFKAIGKIDSGVQDQAPDNVVLPGQVDHAEISAALAEADAFFFLSHYEFEGFSVALLEAMAAGLPCVVTDWAANADMVGSTGGIVVSVGDSTAACEALRSLADPSVRTRMSEANVERAQESYGSQTVLSNLAEIYRTLESKKGRS